MMLHDYTSVVGTVIIVLSFAGGFFIFYTKLISHITAVLKDYEFSLKNLIDKVDRLEDRLDRHIEYNDNKREVKKDE